MFSRPGGVTALAANCVATFAVIHDQAPEKWIDEPVRSISQGLIIEMHRDLIALKVLLPNHTVSDRAKDLQISLSEMQPD